MLRFLASATFLTVPLLLTSACQTASPSSTPHQVKSMGYGSVTAYPDYAELTVDASFTRPKLRDAVTEVQSAIDQVLTLSKRYASNPNDVRVSSTSSNKDFTYVNNKEVFTGFNSTQSVTIRINDLQRLSPYMEELLATKINRIKGLSYGHSKADSLRREAHVLALADAVKTADKMCAALQVRRGAVVEASDLANSAGGRQEEWGESADIQLYAKGFGGRGFKLSPELLHFNSTCSLVSTLEQ